MMKYVPLNAHGTLFTLLSHNEFGKGNNPERKNYNVTNFGALRGWALLELCCPVP